jgi:cytochrome c biogenesis protein CcdA
MIEIIPSLISLAFVDSINPCEMGIFLLMLLAVSRIYKNKKALISYGLAFILTMYFGYFFIGYLLVEVFSKVSGFLQSRIYINIALSIFAIILGIYQLISYFKEMKFLKIPKFAETKIKEIIASLTSPIGAIFLAIFSLTFLTPCTMGPYVIACGLLSSCKIYEVIILLAIYNAIFVLPLTIIFFIIYFGILKAEKILKRRKKFEKIMNLITGILLIIIGILIFLQFT